MKSTKQKHSSHILETTLAIIKPDGMQYRQEIVRMLRQAGFQIIHRRCFKLSPDEAAEFYSNKTSTEEFNVMVLNLTRGPIEVMCLAKDNCIEDWKLMIGSEIGPQPSLNCSETIGAKYGPVVHGSQSERCAKSEIRYFFPNAIIEPIRQEDTLELFANNDFMKTLFDGLYKVSTIRPEDPINWLSGWLLQNNPLKPIITEASDQSEANMGDKCRTLSTEPSRVDSSSSTSSVTLKSSRDGNTFFCNEHNSPENIDDQHHLSGEYVLKRNDITFCSMCQKIKKCLITDPDMIQGSESLSSEYSSSSLTSSND